MLMAASCSAKFCSSFAARCKISHQRSPPLSLPRTSSLLLSTPNSLNLLSSHTALSPVPKFSESEAAVVDAESLTYEEPEPSQVVEAADDEPQPKPKREEIFAVVMIGSRQYIVFPGRFIYTQRLKGANVNDKIVLNKVLLVGTKTTTYIGKPVVTNAAVHAVVEEQGLNPKVIVFKYKKKKHYRRNIGHRQPNTRLRITGITGFQDYPAVTNLEFQ